MSDLQDWIEKELNGYDIGEDIPEYRKIFGYIRALHPYYGWQPIVFKDPKEGEILSQNYNRQSVAELESLLEGRGSAFRSPFSQEIQRALSEGSSFMTEASLHVSRTELIKILDAEMCQSF